MLTNDPVNGNLRPPFPFTLFFFFFFSFLFFFFFFFWSFFSSQTVSTSERRRRKGRKKKKKKKKKKKTEFSEWRGHAEWKIGQTKAGRDRKPAWRTEVSKGLFLRVLLTCYTIEGDRAVSREASRAPEASKGTLTTLVAAKRLGRRHPATTYPTIRKTKQKPMYPAALVHGSRFSPAFVPLLIRDSRRCNDAFALGLLGRFSKLNASRYTVARNGQGSLAGVRRRIGGQRIVSRQKLINRGIK